MKFLLPDWPAPAHIHAAVTLRPSGLDLSIHHQEQARQSIQLQELLALPTIPVWLRQVHGDQVIWADQISSTISMPEADASIANYGTTVCAVLTADCLPILLCDTAGQQIAAIHAGWRGQVAGIIENTVRTMTVPANKLLVWLGPAIGPQVYEVGEEVYTKVMQTAVDLPAAVFFQEHGANKWLMDLYAIAKFKLQALGVPPEQIFGGSYCTYSDPNLFYSYRRSKTTQRMASLIWFSA
jgi:YfiH family protein